MLLVHGSEGFQALSSVPSLQGLRGRYSACGKNTCVETFTLAPWLGMKIDASVCQLSASGLSTDRQVQITSPFIEKISLLTA